jgi:tetratricopeptide (TPR) repeat protein
MIRTATLWVLLASAALASAAFAQSKTADLCSPPPGSVPPSLPAKLLSGQGSEYIRFPITTSNPKAQEFFTQGVAQMHSFWATEAERSFLQAAALDPEAPMPQWGIAMVAHGEFRPRFQLENDGPSKRRKSYEGAAKRAFEAARKARELSAVAGKATPLEKLYIEAAAARLDLASKDPNAGYIKGLRAILAQYPGEVEAKTYLALHLMRGFETPAKTPRDGSMEAVALLRELVKDVPDHPGAHHYVIHGFEGSTFAKDAWPSCVRYAELVPNIPHALHMPGHIYAQTGKWAEAAKSFEDAAANELGYIKADALYTRGHHGHNVHFLASTYSYQERYDKAVEAARGLMEFKENPREAAAVDNSRTPFRQGWFSLMRAMVQNEKWDEILDGKTLPAYNKPREIAWRAWASGLAYSAKGDPKAAAQQLKAMEASLKQLKAKTKGSTPAYFKVAQEELKGQVALASKNSERGLKILQSASRKERALRYSEPTNYPRPVIEVLAQAALRNGKLELAKASFQQALEQNPASPRAERGLAETVSRIEKGVLKAGL